MGRYDKMSGELLEKVLELCPKDEACDICTFRYTNFCKHYLIRNAAEEIKNLKIQIKENI